MRTSAIIRQLARTTNYNARAQASRTTGIVAATFGATTALLLYNEYQRPIKLDAPPPKVTVNSKQPKLYAFEDVAAHRTRDDCWIILDGKVWDVTNFLEFHPGGAAVIAKNAGRDVTALFKPIHPPGTLELHSGQAKLLGEVDPATVPKAGRDQNDEVERIKAARLALPPVEQVRGLKEMEALAKTVLAKRAGIYYAGGSDDEESLRDSFASYQRCRLRPRVLVDVREVDPRTTILGTKSTLPIFVAPAAHARLGHDDGELNIVRGAARTGIPQGISANASYNLEDLIEEKDRLVAEGDPEVAFAYQIYINRDRSKTEKILKQAIDGGCKSFFLTVDSPTLGNREADFREQGLAGNMDEKPHDHPNTETFGYYDTGVTWKDLAWIKKHTGGLPLYIKGVATVEDVQLARKHGATGVLLSNHGGRQLDYARSPLDTLIEIVETDPSLTKDLEVYVDGGVRRGTDVLKALCLGAKGVGMGRPFLYAQSAYADKGVVRTVRIMENEIITGMRLLGARTLKDLKPEMVECLENTHRVPGQPRKRL
ncbi:L-mandelate dehydrogenase [Meredithblackwellia eburnea MCA 4105]